METPAHAGQVESVAEPNVGKYCARASRAQEIAASETKTERQRRANGNFERNCLITRFMTFSPDVWLASITYKVWYLLQMLDLIDHRNRKDQVGSATIADSYFC